MVAVPSFLSFFLNSASICFNQVLDWISLCFSASDLSMQALPIVALFELMYRKGKYGCVLWTVSLLIVCVFLKSIYLCFY